MQPTGTQNYIELAITISPTLFEPYIAILTQEGIEYFLEEDDRLLAYLPESEWE